MYIFYLEHISIQCGHISEVNMPLVTISDCTAVGLLLMGVTASNVHALETQTERIQNSPFIYLKTIAAVNPLHVNANNLLLCTITVFKTKFMKKSEAALRFCVSP